MVWSNTPMKEKSEETKEEAEESEHNEQEEDSNGKPYLKFTEKDFSLRKPLPNYQMFKQLESLCLSANSQKPNLKTYVLCSGIMYGNGEDVFYNQFKKAYLQVEPNLKIIEEGNNRIPTIHVRDLATFVKSTIEK
jgi:adenylate kinase